MNAKRLLGFFLASLTLVLLVGALPSPLLAQPGTESAVGSKPNVPAQSNQHRRPPAASPGYIRVGPTGHYFQFEDGTPFVPIGHNEWTGTLMEPKAQSQHVDTYLRNMRDNGENVLRIILDGTSLYVEKPAGVFNPDCQRFMDRLVRSAEKNGIYLMIAMWHNVFNLPRQLGLWSCWGDHPYNKANGGPVAKYNDLFSSPEAMKLQEARIRYFVDNWGESDHIFAWELANEFNRDNNRWIEHMAAYLKNYEVSKYGKSHLRCISVSHSDFGGPDSAQWSCSNLDFATFHTYGKTDFRSIQGREVADLENGIFLVPEIVARARSRAKDRPVFDSEIPGIVHGRRKRVLGFRMQDEVIFEYHLTVGWAYLCSGAAGAGLRWASNPSFLVHGHPNALNLTMYRYQSVHRRFSDEIDWNRMEAVSPVAVQVRSADGRALRAVCSSSRDKRYLVGWVFDQFATLAPDTTQATLTFPPMPPGSHRVRWFEGTTGNEMKTDLIDGPPFSVTSPPFLGHAAFYIEPRR